MTLFRVERTDHDSPVVIEAAGAVAADGWWTFRNGRGHVLVTLPAGAVRAITTFPAGTGAKRPTVHEPAPSLQRPPPAAGVQPPGDQASSSAS